MPTGVHPDVIDIISSPHCISFSPWQQDFRSSALTFFLPITQITRISIDCRALVIMWVNTKASYCSHDRSKNSQAVDMTKKSWMYS